MSILLTSLLLLQQTITIGTPKTSKVLYLTKASNQFISHKMRITLYTLLAFVGVGSVMALNCPDDINCCFKNHQTCTAKFSDETCYRLANTKYNKNKGPIYCKSCPTDCCSYDSAAHPPECTSADSDCWTAAPNLYGHMCKNY